MLIRQRYLYGILGIATIPFFIIFAFSFIEVINGKQVFSFIAFEQLFSEIRLKELYTIITRAIWVSLFSTIFSFVISYLLFKKVSLKYRFLFLFLITLPLFINESVRVFSWQLVLSENGLFNSILSQLTNDKITLFNGSNSFNIIFVMLVSIIPFGIFINTASLSVVPRVYWKAAEDLGLNGKSVFFRIAIPLSLLSITISFIISFFLAFSLSSEVNYLGGDSKISIRNLILSFMGSSSFSAIFLLGSILILLILISSLLLHRHSNKKRLKT